MNFLKIITSLLSFQLLFAHLSFSQDVDPEEIANRFHLGLKAGIQFNNIFTDASIENGGRMGIALGLTGTYPLNDLFAIRSEILYSTKGARNNYATNNFNGNVNFGLRYLEVPVMGMITFNRFNIHAGIYGAYRLSTQIVTTGGVGQMTLGTPDISTFDVGFNLGGEVRFNTFHVGARYVGGIINVTGSQQSQEFLEGGTNNTFRIYGIYMLRNLFD